MLKNISNHNCSYFLVLLGINLSPIFKNFLFLILFIFNSSFLFSQKQNLTNYPEVSPYSISLKNIDHNSDGFLVTLSTGKILHFFRIDPGQAGSHIGNGGRIAKRFSSDDGLTWSTPEIIYNDQWDNRNIHGGIIGTDTITLTFRSYDAFANTHKGYFTMHSFDSGNSWTLPVELISQGKASGTNQIFKIHNRGYYNSLYDINYLELRFSPDGINWDSIVHVWDYRTSHQFVTSEASFTSLGNDTIIGLIRNDSMVLGQTLLQVVSFDAGSTWSQPTITNIADSLYCPSPWIFYDTTHNDIWVIATDRRGDLGSPFTHFDEKIWVYKNSPAQIINNSQGYSLFSSELRPFPNTKRFYGYPISTKKINGNYLVIFTESEYRGNNGEWAYLYQFNINYGPDFISETSQYEINYSIYPNPAKDYITIRIINELSSNSTISLYIVNSIGKRILSKTLCKYNFTNNEYIINCKNLTAGIYNCIFIKDGKTFCKTFLKQY